MGRQVFYMAGFFGGFAKVIGSSAKAISKSVKTGSNFGKYVGKTTDQFLTGPRINYLNDVDAFKVGKMNENQIEQARLLVNDNPKILEDLYTGAIDRKTAESKLSRLFNDEGVRSTAAENRSLSKNVVRHSMDHTNKTKIWSNFYGGVTKEQVGGVAGGALGGGLILGVGALIIYGVASTISAMFGGAFDKLLDASAESETGTFIMMGVVIVGSILAINFVRETIT